MTGRVRVALIGTGVIAQVMHLHYLAEMTDRYEVAAVCDLDADGGPCSRPGPFGIILSCSTPTVGSGSRPGWPG